jgi:hypothetical protein
MYVLNRKTIDSVMVPNIDRLRYLANEGWFLPVIATKMNDS